MGGLPCHSILLQRGTLLRGYFHYTLMNFQLDWLYGIPQSLMKLTESRAYNVIVSVFIKSFIQESRTNPNFASNSKYGNLFEEFFMS